MCGACIEITGPLGTAKATIEDQVRGDDDREIIEVSHHHPIFQCPVCGRGRLVTCATQDEPEGLMARFFFFFYRDNRVCRYVTSRVWQSG